MKINKKKKNECCGWYRILKNSGSVCGQNVFFFFLTGDAISKYFDSVKLNFNDGVVTDLSRLNFMFFMTNIVDYCV